MRNPYRDKQSAHAWAAGFLAAQAGEDPGEPSPGVKDKEAFWRGVRDGEAAKNPPSTVVVDR